MDNAHDNTGFRRVFTGLMALLGVLIVVQLGVLLHRQLETGRDTRLAPAMGTTQPTLADRVKSWFASKRHHRAPTPDTVWDPANQMALMHEQINRMMDQAFRDAAFFPLAPAAVSNATTSGGSAPSPWHQIDRMRREIDALFVGAMDGVESRHTGFDEGWSGLTLTPSLNVRDGESAYEISLQLPGIEKSRIQVTMDGTILSIAVDLTSRETAPESPGEAHWHSFQTGRFERRLRLPLATSRHDDIKATFEDGVLRIIVPKVSGTESTVRSINVI